LFVAVLLVPHNQRLLVLSLILSATAVIVARNQRLSTLNRTTVHLLVLGVSARLFVVIWCFSVYSVSSSS